MNGKCILTIKLLFSIILLNQWIGVESNPDSSGSGGTTAQTTASGSGSPVTNPQGSTVTTAPVTNPSGSTETNPSGSTVTTAPVTNPQSLNPSNFVVVDISETQSTGEISYRDRNGFVTYTPMSGKVFSKVSKGSTVIWESDGSVSCIKVRTKLFSNNERFLLILLSNNLFKLFHQSDVSEPLSDITGQRCDLTKLKFLGHNDKQLKSVDFTVSILDFYYTFEFRPIARCLRVNYDNHDVWKYTDNRKFSEITTFYYGIVSNRFFVENKDYDFEKLEYKPDSTDSTTSTPESSGQTTSTPESSGQTTSTPESSGPTTSTPESSGQTTSTPESSGQTTSAPETE